MYICIQWDKKYVRKEIIQKDTLSFTKRAAEKKPFGTFKRP